MLSNDQNKTGIPPEAIQLLRNGNKIEAIKITRKKTGLGLKEAKNLIEQYSDSGEIKSHVDLSLRDKSVMPVDAVAELNRGNKVAAIKIVRKQNRIGLKEAKDLVENYIAGNASLQRKFSTMQANAMKKLGHFIIICLGIIALVSLFLH